MSFSFKVIKRLPPPKVQLETIKAEVKKAVDSVAKQHIAERRRITDRFSFDVDWQQRVNVRETGLQLLIYLRNARTKVGSVSVAQLLEWLFVTGTKPHTIRAKNAKFLRFEAGNYDRITPREGTRPGSGSVTDGEVVFRKEVVHPGFPPSPALKNINFKLGGALTRAFRLGIANGLRRK